MGRPRKAGQRSATLAKVAADAATVWRPVHVEHGYGGGARDLPIASATAVWRHNGLPAVPIRWVLMRDPKTPDAPAQALLCTDADRTPEEIVTWFVRRWRIETTFEEVRTHLGVEAQRRWSDRAIWRGQHVRMSPRRTDRRKIPFRLPPAWAQALCNAA